MPQLAVAQTQTPKSGLAPARAVGGRQAGGGAFDGNQARLRRLAPAPPIVTEALARPGRPLDEEARAVMEAGLGVDLSGVRVHTDPLAARSASAIGARAYAAGSRIAFAEGAYAPDTMAGRHELAHELAHVLQGDDATVRRLVTSPSASGAAEVVGHLNSFCPGSASLSATSIVADAAKCAAPAGPGCECACKALKDSTRTFDVSPVPCDLKMKDERVMPGGATTSIPESSVWPNTMDPNCNPWVPIKIPKAGSSMEFGAFQADGSPFWMDTSRILAHELCGHGVKCQTYEGHGGDRPQHDSTIDTENAIAAPPTRGHYADSPPPPGKARQGESFTNKLGDRTMVSFRLKDGWHFEAP